jgi:hypothetical protein
VFVSLKIRRSGKITGGVGKEQLGEIGEEKYYSKCIRFITVTFILL